MTDLPKFQINNPCNREEVLISQMVKLLNDTTMQFIKTNFVGNVTHEQFVILRDASIGYAGAMARDLAKMIAEPTQMMPFLNMAKKIYNAYIDSIEESINNG